MATLTTAYTFTAGDDATSARLNTHATAITELQGLDRCWVYNSANISVATSGTPQALTFNSEQYDSNGMHSTVSNTSRITIQKDGYYNFYGHAAWAGNATGYRELKVVKNGTTDIWIVRQDGQGASTVVHQGIAVPPFSSTTGDYYELYATQTSGGALNALTSGVYGIAFAAMQVSG